MELEGLERALPPIGLSYFLKKQKSAISKSIEENPELQGKKRVMDIMGNYAMDVTFDVLEISDVNDAFIIGTTFLPGDTGPVNIRGESISDLEIALSFGGALVPFVSGSFLNKMKSFKNWRIGSADVVNRFYINNDYFAPYKAGSEVIEFQTSKIEQFVRFYGENGAKHGRWMMKLSDVLDDSGNLLDPKEIKNIFSLPEIPTHMVEVNVPVNTIMRSGEASAIPEFGGEGGGIQFELLENIPISSFSGPKKIE